MQLAELIDTGKGHYQPAQDRQLLHFPTFHSFNLISAGLFLEHILNFGSDALS